MVPTCSVGRVIYWVGNFGQWAAWIYWVGKFNLLGGHLTCYLPPWSQIIPLINLRGWKGTLSGPHIPVPTFPLQVSTCQGVTAQEEISFDICLCMPVLFIASCQLTHAYFLEPLLWRSQCRHFHDVTTKSGRRLGLNMLRVLLWCVFLLLKWYLLDFQNANGCFLNITIMNINFTNDTVFWNKIFGPFSQV